MNVSAGIVTHWSCTLDAICIGIPAGSETRSETNVKPAKMAAKIAHARAKRARHRSLLGDEQSTAIAPTTASHAPQDEGHGLVQKIEKTTAPEKTRSAVA